MYDDEAVLSHYCFKLQPVHNKGLYTLHHFNLITSKTLKNINKSIRLLANISFLHAHVEIVKRLERQRRIVRNKNQNSKNKVSII